MKRAAPEGGFEHGKKRASPGHEEVAVEQFLPQRAAVGGDLSPRWPMAASPTYSDDSSYSYMDSDNCNISGCTMPSPSCGIFGMNSRGKWEEYDETNAMLAKELNAMSLNERNKLFEEIHGVVEETNETNDYLNEKLKGLQEEIDRVAIKPAYNMAHLLSPAYARDRFFRVATLRASRYDTRLSAKRIIEHFALKYDMFGLDRLVHPITQDDLPPNSLKVIREGRFQILSQKDRSGRQILFASVKDYTRDLDLWQERAGVLYYVLMKSMEGEKDLTKGFVLVLDSSSDPLVVDPRSRQDMQRMSQLGLGIPRRMAACHWLHNNPAAYIGVALFQRTFNGRGVPLRVRTHSGSPTECCYKLMSFGIPAESLPMSFNKESAVLKWNEKLDRWRQEERDAASAPKDYIIPCSKDVLLGRGYQHQRFVGNLFLAAIVELNRDVHAATFRSKKPNIVRGVVWYIQKVRGGRFLKWNPAEDGQEYGRWLEVDDADARAKVSHNFRAAVRKGLTAGFEALSFDPPVPMCDSLRAPPDDFAMDTEL